MWCNILFWLFMIPAILCLCGAFYCQFMEGGDKSTLGAMFFLIIAGLFGTAAGGIKFIAWVGGLLGWWPITT